MRETYYWLCFPFLTAGAFVAAAVLIPLFTLRLACLTPLTLLQLQRRLRRVRRLLQRGQGDMDQLERLLLVTQGLDSQGRPDGFSWVWEKERQGLARQLLALRNGLKSQARHSS